MFHSDGRRIPARWERAIFRLAAALREKLLLRVRVQDGGHMSVFACQNVLDAIRSMSTRIKEEGTMRWIDADVRPGDTFMDIGANIGVYTLAAGHRVGTSGQVYAFEPHKVNALSLMRNLHLSALSDRVRVFTCALSDATGSTVFNYASLEAASTASQLGHTRVAGSSKEFRPVASEQVIATSVDDLLASGAIQPPTLVKIDVDGNEIAILRGMRALLSGPSAPRAVQVELNVGEQEGAEELMRGCGYTLAERHYTMAGQKALASGKPPSEIAHNAIFRPARAVVREGQGS